MIFAANDTRFEIPDDWWREAGMEAFVPTAESYCFKGTEIGSFGSLELVSLNQFISPKRDVPLDFGEFRKTKLMGVLREIADGDKIHPIKARVEANRFSIHDGFHRYYASIAAG